MKPDTQPELDIERVDSMHWNRTLARQVLQDRTDVTLSFPQDVDPDVIEKVRQQIKDEVLGAGAEYQERGFED
jgi:hypothetical protein